MIFSKVANIALRGITLGSKFSLLFVLAKYLEPSAVGLYGLIVVTVAYGMYPLGFEFYTYSAREVINASSASKGQYIKSQMFFHGCLYLLVVPLFFLIFYYGLLSWHIAPWFFVLLITEHANQELMRMLVAIQRPVMATLSLFIRHGLWAIFVAFLFVFYPGLRGLESVLMAWSVGGVFAFIFAMLIVRGTINDGWSLPVDWPWVRRGVKIALPMLLGTLSLNFIFTADRYWFESLVGGDALGAYVFYMAITASAISFIDSGVFAFIYPAMVAAAGVGDMVKFRFLLRKMLVQALALSVLFALTILLFVDFLLDFISEPLYFELKPILYPMLIMMVLQVVSYVPSYALYTRGADRSIVVGNLMSAFVFFGSASLLIFWDEMLAIPLSLIIVYAFLLIYKCYSYSELDSLPGD